jgi:hypothetical protein
MDGAAHSAWAGKRLLTGEDWQHACERSYLEHGSPRVELDRARVERRPHALLLLKGGSHYRTEGSNWYADGGPRTPDFTAKFVLMRPDSTGAP